MSKKSLEKVFSHAVHASVRCPSTVASNGFMKHICVQPRSCFREPQNIIGMARIRWNVGQRACKVISTSISNDIDAIVLPSIYDAAKRGDDSAIDRLLSVAANSVNASCADFGRTPLHYAALNGHHKVRFDDYSLPQLFSTYESRSILFYLLFTSFLSRVVFVAH
jgi:hypothetical protein